MARDAVHLQVLVDDQWKKVRDLRDYMMALAIVIQWIHFKSRRTVDEMQAISGFLSDI